MKNSYFSRVTIALLVTAFLAIGVPAQKAKPAVQAVKPIIFAVIDDGKSIEPIAYINNGKLQEPVDGGDEPSIISAFVKKYYRSGTAYRLIFGGANGGTVTVKSSSPTSDCGKNIGTVITKAAKTPLKGNVMGLATNATSKSTAASYRRKPSDAERNEIEVLVKAEFAKQKLTPKILRYHNLTAVDVDNDGSAEMVGSYWVEVDRLTRALLFFIAEKGANGKYSFGHREYRSVDQASVMSGDIKNVDEGIYHELLLDVFDVDGDGVAEVFTNTASFEGAGFGVYSRSGSKWTKSFDGSNYHCGY